MRYPTSPKPKSNNRSNWLKFKAYTPSTDNASTPVYSGTAGVFSSRAKTPTSGRFKTRSIALPMYMLAMIAHMSCGLVSNICGPGCSPYMMNTNSNSAVVAEPGMPNVNSGTIAPGAKYTHTFTQPGTYVYYCKIHGYTRQRGTITISGSSSPTTTPTTRPSTTTTTVAGAKPTVSVGDVALSEGDTKTRTAYFPVTLSKASAQTITVNYATANGTAGSGDYVAKSGTLTFAAGKVKANIAVPVKGDVADEADETFTVNLSAPVNATLGDGAGTGTIRDDDPGSGVRLTVGDVTVYEGNSGTQTATFTVSLSGPATSDVTVAYATGDQTAVQPGDYAAKTGTLTFAAGVVNKNVAVTVKSNTGVEPDETFKVTLSNPTGGVTITDNTGVGTIRNDD